MKIAGLRPEIFHSKTSHSDSHSCLPYAEHAHRSAAEGDFGGDQLNHSQITEGRAMTMMEEDQDREERIEMEIVVDAYDEQERH